MVVSLYTSRVILDVLGVDDFGIYQAVAGVIGMFSFLNGALATGTTRYITFSLGEGNEENAKKVFCVSFSLHLLMALLIIVLSETIGLYFLFNKLVLPEDRMGVIFWVYQLSVAMCAVSIIQVPYTADIVSHERMNIYAYLSILEVALKLAIVFCLTIGTMDKLLLYSVLLLVTQLIVLLVYVKYCRKNFQETKSLSLKQTDISMYKEIGSFSGWSLLSVSSAMLANQGVIILLNIFFSPAIVAARAISIQVNNVVNQFVQNFRTAVNPQIVKSYAQNDMGHSSFLVLVSTKVSFFLVLLMGMPIIMNADYLLRLWLIEVPDYCVIFLQLVIVQSLFQTIDNSLYYGLYACGKIKQNALISPTIALTGFPICYLLFRNGHSPVAMSWCYIIIYMVIGLLVKPYLLKHLANYSIRETMSTLLQCLSVFIPILAYYYFFNRFVKPEMNSLGYLLLSSCLSAVLTVICVYQWGLEKELSKKIFYLLINKIKK